jgi:hypothetical protein
MKLVREDTYRVSERVLLARGDRFTATGGPYWKSSDGSKLPLKSYGPYTFHSHVKRGAVEWIECLDKDGCFAVLHVAGRRRRLDKSHVPRPYIVKGKKRRA